MARIAKTVQQVAECYQVDEHTVLFWLRTKELEAVNVGRSRGRRPRWRITEEALAAFEAARTATPPATLPTPRRKKCSETGVIQFYQ